ncbi:hypothetical protein GCM10023340_41330 [Nocardioides marinquilinus]|uniref:DoxX family protein n=1 Tax=Nocardioides marinquilinus TaxID=1210400 RepID=A0ABP9Q1M0_9ACTN
MALTGAVLAVLLAVVMASSAVAKLRRQPDVEESLDRAEVARPLRPVLAGVELVGSLGLVAGIWVRWAGVAAAVGFFVYFVLAIVAHLRAGEIRGVSVPFVLALIAGATALLWGTEAA